MALRLRTEMLVAGFSLFSLSLSLTVVAALLWWQAPKTSQNIAPTFSCQLNFPFFPQVMDLQKERERHREGDPAADCIDCTR